MATHSSTLGWRIPWTEEPSGLHSMESQSQTQLSKLLQTLNTLSEVKELKKQTSKCDKERRIHYYKLLSSSTIDSTSEKENESEVAQSVRLFATPRL